MIDLLGIDLEQAMRQLSSKGFACRVRETKPHNKEIADGFFRVIKQDVIEDNYILTVCRVPDAFKE
ncbi:MAG: PASTA domain-containing protein [Eubacteriales bacterium]|nr:PASTA domain-containing protein [Eubacteriales bacterium]